MFERLMNWLRPIKCDNFTCNQEWDGYCYAKNLTFGLYAQEDESSLACKNFKHCEEF